MGTINLKTRRQTIGGVEGERFVTAPVRGNTIDTEALIEYASENSGISKAQMAASFYAVMQQVEQFLMNGHNLVLGNLGRFYLSFETKAAETENAAGASAVKRVSVKFRQSKKLKNKLKHKLKLNSPRKPNAKSAGNDNTAEGSEDSRDI